VQLKLEQLDSVGIIDGDWKYCLFFVCSFDLASAPILKFALQKSHTFFGFVFLVQLNVI
jgi:hypothetical protein